MNSIRFCGVMLIAITVVDSSHAEEVKNSLGLNDFEHFKECPVCPEMVVLPTEQFLMGAELSESAFIYSLWYKVEDDVEPGFAHEGPVHKVVVDIPIAMGVNEVTYGEWQACVDGGGCPQIDDVRILQPDGTYFVADDRRHPIIGVNYHEALQYIDWLNDATGTEAYRLPTEAEWEYAARAWSDTTFPADQVPTQETANIAVIDIIDGRQVPASSTRYHVVSVDDLAAQNAWGLRHMSGNVLELTSSCFYERHLPLVSTSEYLAASTAVESCDRVGKGGWLNASADYARPAFRGRVGEKVSSTSIGFRVVRLIE